MDRRTAKDLLHIRGWLQSAQRILHEGQASYLSNVLLQEAGDALMMKIGEAARRLALGGVAEPDGVAWADAVANRNWLIHQYDAIDREITWATLEQDLPRWMDRLGGLFADAEDQLGSDTDG